MSAMHQQVLDAMGNRLTSFKDRMVGQIPFDLTHYECIRLIAPSDHIQILTDAAKYADIRAAEEWLKVDVPAIVDGSHVSVDFFMRTHAQKEPPLRPRTPYWQLPTEPGAMHAGEKVIAWVTKRLELGRRFGLAHWVLHKLAADCDTGTQVRYLWPVVMHLCSGAAHDTRLATWAEKYAVYKPVRYAPQVSPQLKRAIQDSSALLTTAVLMGDDAVPLEHGEVKIDIWNLPSFNYDGITLTRK